MSNEETLYKLVNPDFDFEWNGQIYQIKKATLSDVVAYQKKMKELLDSKEIGWEVRLASYCLFLALRNKIQGLTEEQVMDNTPADIDMQKLLLTLGFMKPVKTVEKEIPTTEKPSSTSPSEQDGVQEK
jgi:hypothetical protein